MLTVVGMGPAGVQWLDPGARGGNRAAEGPGGGGGRPPRGECAGGGLGRVFPPAGG
ncbi:hypothetical protein M8371_20590 [Klebsiella pneumoniae]|nr:hypothetical protein [Klebsiella pneumoniae]